MKPARGARLVRIALVSATVCVVVAVSGCGVSGKPAAESTTKPAATTTQRPTTSTPTSEPTTGALVGQWQRVVDPPSGLSFQLPKQPTLLKPPVTAPDGAPVTVRGYQALVNPNLLVQVSVYDLAGRSFDADKAIDGVATSSHGAVVARQHTESDGLDIVDAKIRIPTGPALGYDRVFKIGDHAVQLWTLGLASNAAQIRLVQQHLSSTFRR
ncbi:MAG: hypothetical protein M3Z46_02765 [Actinomycetota bacterium]|nr:hypothetical protein [Actinomycetota bacterium]